MSTEGSAFVVSNSLTNSLWFKRFMRGCHKRMCDVWLPDRPLTIHEILACLAVLEGDWIGANLGDVQACLYIAITGVMLSIGFLGALRGEEIIRIDIGGMREYWNEGIHHPYTLSCTSYFIWKI